MEQTYFRGHERAKKIQVIESGGIKSVIVNRKVYITWASWDTASQRMVIAQLYKARYGTQQDLSLVFGIHINTVQKYVADFTRDGLEGLITQRGGPRGRWKLTPGLRAKILILALKEGILGYEAIQERLELWHEHVTIPSIRQVLLENGFVHERVSVDDVEVKQTSFFDPHNDGQLRLPFSYEVTSDKGSEIDIEVKRNRIENVEVNSFELVQPPRSLRYYSHAQRRYLNQLETRLLQCICRRIAFCSFNGTMFFFAVR